MNAEPLLTYEIASPFALPPYGAREADRLYRQVIAVYRANPPPTVPSPPTAAPRRPTPRIVAPREPTRPPDPASARSGPFVVRPLTKGGGVNKTGRATFAASRRDAFVFAILAARDGRSVAVLGRGFTETSLATLAPGEAGAVRVALPSGLVRYVGASADAVEAANALWVDGTAFSTR